MTPMRHLRGVLLLILLAASSCAPPGPPFASVAGTIPPPPPGTARIFFYRWLEPYETLSPTTAFLNNQPVGVTEPGSVLYRDVAPGQYLISVQSEGQYPNQFKTVVLQPGDVTYVRIESLRSWMPCSGGGWAGGGGEGCWDTFVVVIIDPAIALSEMASLRFIRG